MPITFSHLPRITRLAMAGVLLLLLMRAVGLVFWLQMNYSGAESEAATRAYHTARLVEAEVLATDREIDLMLDDVANSVHHLPIALPLDWNSEAGKRVIAMLAARPTRMPNVAVVSVLDAQGRVAYSAKASQGASFADFDYIKEVMSHPERGMVISSPYVLRTTGRPGMAFAKPVLDEAGKVIAIVVAGVHVQAWERHFDGLTLGDGGAALLVDGSNRLVARRPAASPAMLGKVIGQHDVVPTGIYPDTYFSTSTFDGQRRMMAMRQVGDYPLKVMVCLSPQDYLAAWRTQLWVAVLAMVVVLALCIFLWVLLWRSGVQARALAENEVKLRHREAHMRSLVEAAPAALGLLDYRSDRIRFVNADMAALFGLPADAFVDMQPADLFTQPDIWNALRREVDDAGQVRERDCTVRTANEGQRWVLLSATRLADGNGSQEVLLSMIDITARHAREAKLSEEAGTDMLTGLANRRRFFERGREVFELAQRYQRPLSALMLDLDLFKHVNDTYGHAVGDQVLVRMARLMETSRRHGDITARLGGEEFVVLLPETPLERALEAAERIRESVENAPLTLEDGTLVSFTVSIGVAQLRAAASLEALLDEADIALYRAKERGRNRVESAVNIPGI